MVIGQLHDERGLIGAGRGRRGDRAADQHEARDGVLVVADLLGEQVELVVVEDAGRGDGGIRVARSLEDAEGARDIAGGRDVRVRGKGAREPLQALRVGDRVRRDELHVFEAGSGSRDEHEVHRHEVLADDPESGDGGEGILGGGDAAVDGVLDRDHRRVRAPLDDVGERLADVVDRSPPLTAGLGHLRQGGLGEGSGGPEVAVVPGLGGGFGDRGAHGHPA